MPVRHAIIALLLTASAAIRGAEEPKPFLHPLFTDHMVLQRDAKVPVWGWTTPGAKVSIEIAGSKADAVADAQGKWSATTGPFPAGGPFELTVTSGAQTEKVADVLMGDVWLCSGQSNMEMGIGVAKDAEKEIAAAEFPKIRLFTVTKRIATTPVETVVGSWQPCSPASVAANGWGGFSAVGYFFGRHVHAAIGVPIGLIHSSWGGTVAQAWTSREALGAMPDFKDPLAALAESLKTSTVTDADKLMRSWWEANDPGSKPGAGWELAAFDATAWKKMDLPGAWENKGLPNFDGVVWFRKQVEVPADWAGKDLQLDLGPIDDRDTTWFNGTLLGGLDIWNAPRSYTVPGAAVKSGVNVIAVRVLDTGGGGGIYGAPEQMKLTLGKAGASQPLAGEWLYQEGQPLAKLTPVPQRFDSNQNAVTVLYNGMIAPLLPFAIKGAIWYQGESNAGQAKQYRTLLPTMITDWRARFGRGDFPFLIVQLANFMDRKPEPGESAWAELREAQAHTASTLPNTGMAVIIDIGDAKDIHPKNKQEVGRRLGLAAQRIAYGDAKVEGSSPTFASMQVKDHAIRVSFDHIGGGLEARDGALTGFAIAGADGKYTWADAVIDAGTVVVSSPTVQDPVSVRYAWADNPACNLYSKEGMPAVPFRSDAPKD